MYRKHGEPYDKSDLAFINAVRAVLGLAPLPSRGTPNRKNSVFGDTVDYAAAAPLTDGNSRRMGAMKHELY